MSANIFQSKPIVTMDRSDLVSNAIAIMHENKIHHLVITDDGKYFGLFSERCFFEGSAKTAEGILKHKIEDHCITNSPTIDSTADLSTALMQLSKTEQTALPIIDEHKKVIGIVTETDVLKVFDHIFKGEELSLMEKGELFLAENPLAQELIKLLNSFGI